MDPSAAVCPSTGHPLGLPLGPHHRQSDLSSTSQLLLIGGESGKPAVIGPQSPTSPRPAPGGCPQLPALEGHSQHSSRAVARGEPCTCHLERGQRGAQAWPLTSHLSAARPLRCHSGHPARSPVHLASRPEHRLIRAQPQAEPAPPAPWQQGTSGSLVAGGPWAAAPPHTLNLTSSLPLALPLVGHPSNH